VAKTVDYGYLCDRPSNYTGQQAYPTTLKYSKVPTKALGELLQGTGKFQKGQFLTIIQLKSKL